MVNFLALMGWSFGEDQELFTLQEMLEKFDFKNMSLGGPIFDIDKLTWLNSQYIQKLSQNDFVSHFRENIFNEENLSKLFPLIKERIFAFEEFCDRFSFFFNGALDYTNIDIVPKSKEKKDMINMFKDLLALFDELYVWDANSIKTTLDAHCKALGWKPKEYFMPLRLVVTGRKDSPPLVESIECIGREMIRFRLQQCIIYLKKK